MAQYLRTLASDLLTLEVSTIIRENSSSAKMPNSRRIALRNVAEQYREYMIEHKFCHKAHKEGYTPVEGKPTPRFFRWSYGGEYSFNELRTLAKLTQADLKAQMKRTAGRISEVQQNELHKHLQMLQRIEEKSANIIGLFKMRRKEFEKEIGEKQKGFDTECEWKDGQGQEISASDYRPFGSQMGSYKWNNDIGIDDINAVEDIELSPDHITLLRKTWEIGLEQIMLQTTIQIDGDITTIMARDFIQMPDRTQNMFMKVHEDSIGSSTRIWKMLFETIGKIAGQGINKLFDKKAK